MSDTRSARWKRRVAKWRRWMAELREHADVQVIEPPDFDTPPHKRTGAPD